MTVTVGGRPDLVVESPSVDDDSPETGGSFTLSATVSNDGDGGSAATTLRYYRSIDATITTGDTEVGTDAVGTLAASGTSDESIDLTAPSSAGTYYYGACVDDVTGESDTSDNCSSAVTVTVTMSAAGACEVGQVLSPGESCTVGSARFEVLSTGQGRLGFITAGTGITINNFSASRIPGTNTWRIDSV